MKEWSKKSVRNGVFFLLLGVLLGALSTIAVKSFSSGTVIAVVDGKEIKKADLFDAMDRKSGLTTLEQMIDNMVVEKSAKVYGISVSEKEIEDELRSRIAVEYHSESAFLESIRASNMTLDDAREELRLEMLLKRIAVKDIRINDNEVSSYYDKNKDKFSVPEKRRISRIVLKFESDANAVRDRLLMGYDFNAMAREESITSDKKNSGDIGFIVKGTLNPVSSEVEKIAFQLPKNEISPVIKCSDGFHIIKVTEIVQKFDPEFETIKESVSLKARLEKCKPFTLILDDLKKERSIKIKDKTYIRK